jgi:hypothetical protein
MPQAKSAPAVSLHFLEKESVGAPAAPQDILLNHPAKTQDYVAAVGANYLGGQKSKT